ncbi:hypothetical protein WJX73_005728 [Symbiochloris irregularis]|uniref:Phospholipid:diacylglycerol acyltransferase n=1 Tax=Symbiochloris irregularis TaxID=706552 RepID=A0AAW1PCE8_9CHLO
MFRRLRTTSDRDTSESGTESGSVTPKGTAVSQGLEESQRQSSLGIQGEQPSSSNAPNTSQAPRRDGTSVDAGVQTLLSGDYVPAKRKRKRRRNACGCCFNKWTASFVAMAAIIYASRQPLTRMQDRVVDTISPIVPEWATNVVPEWASNSTELQRKLGIDIQMPSLFSEDDGSKRRPGRVLYEEGLRPKHPVIVVPGFVTSGLVLWEGKPCALRFFRERIWGSMTMTHSFVRNTLCWLEHMALDEKTGADPPGVKLRAAEGLEAVDYFMPGYHVWAKLIEALADVGYDSNMLVGETYDWRLAVPVLQQRDGYFTRLKNRIEVMHELHGEKVMVISHSWGDNVFRNFMVWASTFDREWVEQHVAVYSQIAGPTLGVPKSISSFLSGETRDTAELGFVAALLSDSMMPRNKRVSLFRTWGAGIGMLPSGGPGFWGNTTWAPDDTPEMRQQGTSYGPMLTEFKVSKEDALQAERHHSSLSEFIMHYLDKRATPADKDRVTHRHDIDSAMKILLADGDANFKEHVRNWAAVHVDSRSCKCDGHPEEYYFSPLNCPLPHAPSLHMFCMYGVGLPTERSYQYLNFQHPKTLVGTSEGRRERQAEVLWKINSESNEVNGTLDHGIRLSDGDGTVPLLSLGALCRKHWRHDKLNPSGIRLVSREYVHEVTTQFGFRGSGKSADHVDILSHDGVLSDIIRQATGHAADVHDEIHSDLDDIVAQISLHAD